MTNCDICNKNHEKCWNTKEKMEALKAHQRAVRCKDCQYWPTIADVCHVPMGETVNLYDLDENLMPEDGRYTRATGKFPGRPSEYTARPSVLNADNHCPFFRAKIGPPMITEKKQWWKKITASPKRESP